jgi:hypothetical protein
MPRIFGRDDRQRDRSQYLRVSSCSRWIILIVSLAESSPRESKFAVFGRKNARISANHGSGLKLA